MKATDRDILSNNASPINKINKTKKTIVYDNMTKISKFLGEVFYDKNDQERKNPIKILKFSESQDPKSQGLYKYTSKLLEYIKSHLKNIESDHKTIVNNIHNMQLNSIKHSKKYEEYIEFEKQYPKIEKIDREKFNYIQDVLTKHSHFSYLAKILDEINNSWIDIVYGSGESKDIKNLICENVSEHQLKIASLNIKASTSSIFQSKNFLNYLLNHSSDEEKLEFKKVNEEFNFIPKANIYLKNIPSTNQVSKTELINEISKVKQEIWDDLKILVKKNEELIQELAAAITKEEEFEKRARTLSEEYNERIEEVKFSYEKKLKEREENLKKEQEERIKKLEENKKLELSKIKEEYEKDISTLEGKINLLEIKKEEYENAKQEIIKLQKIVEAYEEADKNKFKVNQEEQNASLIDFDNSYEEMEDIDSTKSLNDKNVSNFISDVNKEFIMNNNIPSSDKLLLGCIEDGFNKDNILHSENQNDDI